MKKFTLFITTFNLLLIITEANVDVCETPGCHSIANKIVTNMDLTVKPCEDFYQFICGSYLKRDNDSSPEDQMKSKARNELFQLLESKSVKDLPETFIKAQNYYKSCLNEDTVNKRGLVPMKEALIRYGGWPVITPDWKEKQFDWIETTRLLSEDGHRTNQFVDLKVLYYLLDTTKTVLTLWSPNLNPSDYDGELDSNAYIQLMVAVVEAFGASPKLAKVDMKKVFEFEKKLYDISQKDSRPYTNGLSLETMTVTDLIQKYPAINWERLADAIMGRSVKVTSNDTVLNDNPSYFEKLDDLLKKTPERLIANYLLWNVVLEMLSLGTVDSNTMLLWKKYSEQFGPYNFVRRDFCLDMVTADVWGAIVGPAYVHRYISPVIKQQGLEVTKVYQKKLIDVLQSQDWMDDETKVEAEKKIKNVVLNIGYPDEFTNYDLINQYSQTLQINEGTFYENTFNSRRWFRDKQDSMLHRPFNKASWEEFSYVTDFNAMFNDINVITFMATYLDNFISSDWPDFLRLVSIGRVSGHQLTHAIDKQGSRFDSSGNPRDWWTNETRHRFDVKVDAMIAEYSSYYVKEANQSISGEIVTNEMIAEHGAYMLVNKVIVDYLIKNPSAVNSKVAGLERFNPKQLSWILPTSHWCKRFTAAEIIERLNTNYLPSEYRVNIPLRNSPDFAKDWNCPEGSWMNKKEKINVWY